MTRDEVSRQPVSVLVACLHEEDTIRECLERITRAMPNAEVIVIHGGTDRTFSIAAEMARDHPGIRPIRNENDQGKGHAIRVGIARASHDRMCQFDADLQFAPEDIPDLFVPLFNGRADLVIGSRFLPESDDSNYRFSFFRVVGNRVVNGWMSLLCGTRITDVTTGSKAWTRQAIEDIDFRDVGFVYEVEIPMRAYFKGYRIAQVPVSYHNRQGGISGHGAGWKEYKSLARSGLCLLWTTLVLRLTRGRWKASRRSG